MISKRSFIKLLKDDGRKRVWLWVLSVLVFCVVFPGMVLDNIQGMADIYGKANLCQYFGRAVSFGEKRYYLAAVCAMAVTCAISGFSYVHSRSKLNFYHSLPVKREVWLALQFTSSILIFAVPTGLQVMVEFFIGMVYDVLNQGTILILAGTFCLYFLIFATAYLICVLAMLMTGKMLVGILMMLGILGFSGAAAWIYRTFEETFYQGYLRVGELSFFQKYPSPIALMMDLSDSWGKFVRNNMDGGLPVGKMAGMAAFGAGLAFINVWLYRNRKTEAAGNAVVFPKISMVLEFFVVLAASLAVGILLKTFSYTQSDVWFFGGIALGVLIFTAAVDFIYYTDIRNVLKRPVHLLVIVVSTFGAALIFRFDLLGYDAYLPEVEQISSMSVENYRFSNVYNSWTVASAESSSGTTKYSGGEILNSYQMTEFEPIYAMAENGRENAKKKNEGENTTCVNIRYNLTNGRTVYRSYRVDEDVFNENARKLYEKPGFIRAMYPVFSRNINEMETVYASGVKNGEGYYHFESEEEKQEFVNTYKEELLTVRYEELSGEGLVGNLSIGYQEGTDDFDDYDSPMIVSSEDMGYPVLDRFGNTLAVLEKMGIEFQDTLDADSVGELTVMCEKYDEYERTLDLLAVEAGKTDLISDRQKKELLDMLSYKYCQDVVSYNTEETYYYITAYGKNDEYLQTFFVPAVDLPEDIKEIIERNL